MLQLEQESKDLMDATIMCRESGGAMVVPAGKQRVAAIERVRVDSHLKVNIAKNLTTAAALQTNTTSNVDRLLQLYNDTELPDAASQARNEMIARKTAATAGLSASNDRMRGHLESLDGLTDVGEMMALSKTADAEMKQTTKEVLTPFNRAIAAFKKMLAIVEREQAMAMGDAKQKETKASHEIPPLFTMLRMILEGGDINTTTSLFEAKQGHRIALLGPQACLYILGIGRLRVSGWDGTVGIHNMDNNVI
jgi:hypothetical protein